MPNLGDIFPDFEAETTTGPIKFHQWLGDSWGILFSHPADYTPVCTTELGHMATNMEKFESRNVKVIALSCNSLESHEGWINDIRGYCKEIKDFPFPIIADEKRNLAVKLGMLDPVEKDAAGMPLTCRALFIIGPDKKLKLSILYPATTGRNFHEVVRVIDSLQLTYNKQLATPANWKQGDPCMVIPSVKEEDEARLFPKGVTRLNLPSGKGYLRLTPQPDL